ncbi:MAG: peptidoglycan DD-metalloendopeptidase family protein [Candidatus Microbacterium phytovorans]|uniref:Peptidoglycan DD-metalloendopeptidase family protein n=1 Tax=Candidatus Microbacterium phytovorans TaxID=3121374 RepID=A0AAJ5W0Z3_9MICO|nr:peptidoglycan DD-metalloendopeptidase family protein [Microbacterium sp.]WEK12542.1 MAG: peptidoglycan DD-metalloendopeptidase family protein [Microbacterium sp.]
MLGILDSRRARALAALTIAALLMFGMGAATEAASAASRFTSAPTPTVSGTAKVGLTLTAKPGTWKPKATLKYQWYRGSVAISGATKSTYVLRGADAGKTLKVKVTGSKTGYTSVAKVSKSTRTVAKGTFSQTPTPTVSGTLKVGGTVTATTGTWKPAPTLKYQWYRDGVAITGAKSSSYKLSADDYGSAIKVRVAGTKTGYTTVAQTSKATTSVGKGSFDSAATPSITGAAKVGETLTAQAGNWAPAGATFTYQWAANGSPVAGATSSTFTPGFAQQDAAVTVTVTGSLPYLTALSRTSAPVTVAAPSILRANQTLTANKSLRSPNGTYRLTMQTDGNLVAYGPSGAIWATGGGDATRAVMQSDGNLVTYNSGGSARWESGSWGTGGNRLLLQDDGNLVIYDSNGKAVWARNVVGWIKVYPGSTAGNQSGTQSQSAANLSSTLFRVYPVGTRLPVVCGVTNGQGVDGSATPGTTKSSTWHRLLWGDWVADADFNTTVNGLVPKGTIGFVASEPNCGGGGGGSSTTLPGMNGWVYPIQPHGKLTTYAGHNGDDFPVPIGTPVYAMYGGTVSIPAPYKVESSWCPVPEAIGRTQQDLIVNSSRDGRSYRFDYAHLNSFTVSNGQTVKAGDLIGYSGNKGCVTGPHLHIDIKVDGVAKKVFPHDLIGWSY